MSDGSIPEGTPPEVIAERIKPLDIEDELRSSYLTYAMSVIVSRALPDARDGLKPSQRRILVAMNDLNLGPASHRIKCAKISGDTSGNYHPHGESVIYPTLVRLAQAWIMRDVLIDKQGNFGSLAGLPPAAMRYTEARMSAVASEMLDDLERDTVDFVPNYDQRSREPVVLPSRFPNLLVNGSSGIAVGMATSIPPHNLNEVADAVIKIIDEPDCTIDDMLEVMPGPDFPTGGIICGREGIRQGYLTGRSTITLRAATHFDTEKNSDVIVVTEIPYLETRDRLKEKLEDLIREDRIKGIARDRRLHGSQDARVAGAAAHCAQARCRPRSRAQSAFSVLDAASHLQFDFAGVGGKPAADAVDSRIAAGIPAAPRDGDSPPHRVPA